MPPAVTTGLSLVAVRFMVEVTKVLVSAAVPAPPEFASVTCHEMVRDRLASVLLLVGSSKVDW